MAKKRVPHTTLADYLPPNSFEQVMEYLNHYKVHLTIARQRQSILGDYRHAHGSNNHRISVNSNLNKYSFLVTLLHELAHLFTYEKFGNRVSSHGVEWKKEFSLLLVDFISKKIFPPDIELSLQVSLRNPAASSCADDQLLRVLKKYDPEQIGVYLLEQLQGGSSFSIAGNRVFRKGDTIRKRIKCQEVSTGKWYLFSPVYEVKVLPQP
ncbi:MAG: SprT-like domain-containing protein [Ferruginibacter sp.]